MFVFVVGGLYPWQRSVCEYLAYPWSVDWCNLSTRKPQPESKWIWWREPCMDWSSACKLTCPLCKDDAPFQKSIMRNTVTSVEGEALEIKNCWKMASEYSCHWKIISVFFIFEWKLWILGWLFFLPYCPWRSRTVYYLYHHVTLINALRLNQEKQRHFARVAFLTTHCNWNVLIEQ